MNIGSRPNAKPFRSGAGSTRAIVPASSGAGRWEVGLRRFLFFIACAGLLASPLDAAPAANYQGLWWKSPAESESGWGINFAHQGDVIFATWFTYDLTGKGMWLVMAATKTASGAYTGTLYRLTGGPAFDAVPFPPVGSPGGAAGSVVGTGSLTFTDADNGSFAYTVNGIAQTKAITREVFGSLPTCVYGAQPDLALATNYQDLWWAAPAESQSGWGINLTHQGDTLFASWFTYDRDHTPMWLVVSAPKTAPGTYSGTLVRAAGPPFNAVPFPPVGSPGGATGTNVGTATFTFANGNSASFTYTVQLAGMPSPVTQTKMITRQLFAPPAGTVCGEPYRTLTSVTIVVAADIGQCFDAPAAGSGAAKTAALVTPQDVLVLTAGDNTYDYGTPAEFANCFHPTWGAFKDRIFPTIGNHEYYTLGAEGYFGYFGAQAGPDRRGYYSFDYGGWHFISLNSVLDIAPQSEQYLWLKSDLAKSKDSLCTIALMHYPAFNSGAVYGSIAEMRPFFDALYTGGVEMVFSGHDHLYERFAPQRADGTADPVRGVRQFVIGTGGHTLNPFGTPLPNSEFRYNASWGILRLTLGQGKYSWQFVPVGGGAPIDAGTATCHQ